MRELNNKGFAASVVLYGASTIIIMVLLLILSVLSTGEKNVNNMSDSIKMEASGVKGSTYQLRNMITNGGFEDGATGWTTDMVTTSNTTQNEIVSNFYKSGSKSLHISLNGWQYQRLSGAISKGDLIYFGASVNVESIIDGGLSAGLTYNQNKEEGTTHGYKIEELEGKYTITIATDDSFIRHGMIGKVGDDTEIFAQIGADSTSNIEGYVDNIIVINLTKTFGAGNEPNLAWCNANIEYFEGTTSITVYENE